MRMDPASFCRQSLGTGTFAVYASFEPDYGSMRPDGTLVDYSLLLRNNHGAA